MFHTFLFTSQDDYPEEDKINGKIKEYKHAAPGGRKNGRKKDRK